MVSDLKISGFDNSDREEQQEDRPKILLIGSAMRFSERLLDVFRAEFSDFAFARINSTSDLLITRHDLGNLGLVVVEDQHLQSILDDPNGFTNAIGATQIVIAFTDTKNAARFIAQRPESGTLNNVGFLPLDAQLDVWLAVMRLLLCGHTFIPQELVAEMQATPAQPDDSQMAEMTLTPREWQVLELVAEGVQNKNIAVDLDLSVHTVKLHIHNLLNKIGVRNRTCAASWYMQCQGRRTAARQVTNA